MILSRFATILMVPLVLAGCSAGNSGTDAQSLVRYGCKQVSISGNPVDFSVSLSYFRKAAEADEQYRELAQAVSGMETYLNWLANENANPTFRREVALKLSDVNIIFESYCGIYFD